MEAINSKTKQITLRVFCIENPDLKKEDSGLLSLLSKKLEQSKAKDRRMLLNKEDPKKEEDLICDYNINQPIYISGIVLRIIPSKDVVSIPDQLFEEHRIIIRDLDKQDTKASISGNGYYYFLMDNRFIITNLPLNTTIQRFQTYINWLLEKERGATLFEFTPKIISVPSIQMSGLKTIKVQDTNFTHSVDDRQGDQSSFQKFRNLSKDFVIGLVKDIKGLDTNILEEIISAELLIKFKKKPKNISAEDYQKALGAYMKPISDADNIVFIPKKGNAIKGSDMFKTKIVDIETTESKKISENQLYQEMEKFLQELKNENKS